MAADGLVNRGNTYKEIGRVNEAIQDYLRAISIRPSMAEAHANLASAYKDRYVYHCSGDCGLLSEGIIVFALSSDILVESWCSGLVEAAIKSYRQALVLRPDFPEATCNLLHTLQVIVSDECMHNIFS